MNIYASEFDEIGESFESVSGAEGQSEFEEQTYLDQAISATVIVVIIVAILAVWRLSRQFGGKLKTALILFVSGVLINLVAALWGSFVSHRIAVGDTSFDTHNLFMAIATLFFLASIFRFTRLIPREA